MAATPAGVAFQKCTLAPFDFTSTDFVGIPDEFDGMVVSKNQRLISNLPTYTAGNDLYIVQLPIPGYAYFWGQRAAGALTAITLTGIPYSDSATLFPLGAEATNVTSFRHASNVIEFVPTVNDFTWGGSIQVNKGQVSLGSQESSFSVLASTWGAAQVPIVTGIAELLNSTKYQAVFPLKEGAYVPSFNTHATYDWTAIPDDFTFAFLTDNQALAGTVDSIVSWAVTSPSFLGLGNFEATVMKFPAIIAAQTGIIRCTSCIEYQVSPSSVLYDYAHMSPTYDPTALALIKAFHKNAPVGVCWKDNATFWEHFVKWASRAAKIAGYLPGPIGLIGKATGDLLEVGHELW